MEVVEREIAIERPDRASHGGDERERIAGRLHRDVHVVEREVREREVRGRVGPALEPEVMLVRDDADDLERLRHALPPGMAQQPLADRILAGKVEPGEGLVDHHDPGRLRPVGLENVATAKQLHADRAEVAGHHRTHACLRLEPRRRRGAPVDRERRRPSRAQRMLHRHRDRFDEWHRGEPRAHLLVEGAHFLARLVPRLGKHHLHGEQAVWIEAGVHVL